MRAGPLRSSSWAGRALLCLLVLFPALAHAATVLAIDYGTDGFKASLVKPGLPFDVIINKDSKRKTPSIVAIRGGERLYGAEAASLATRYPKDTLQSVKLLLGHPETSTQSQLHRTLFGNALGTTARGSPSISTSSEAFPVEDVLAMQFTVAKDMAESMAKEPVRETVVAVPSWFSQSERQAILDALDLAGLKGVALLNDGTAAAYNYAMTRTFSPEPVYHIFYDFGAGSTRATLVSLKSVLLPDPYSLAATPELKNTTAITVHGVGFDRSVGGYVFDSVLRDILKEEFEATSGIKVANNPRAMAKLLKEASRVKHVLSANTEGTARIEGLADDVDFRMLVTRAQFEARCSALVPHFSQPLHDALSAAKLTIDDVTSVILVGGSSRVPMVQAAVRSVAGDDKIGLNVNADEAAVMGSALYGASTMRGFRTKDIRVQDITPFGVDVTYAADKPGPDGELRMINTHIFPKFSKTGSKKTMTFKKSSDFALQFSYKKEGVTGEDQLPDLIFETTLTGINAAFENLTAEAAANATVKVTMELDASNLITVEKAVAVFNAEESAEPVQSMQERLKGLLSKIGGKKDEAGEPAAPEEGDAEKSEEELEAARAQMAELLKDWKAANSTVTLTVSTTPLERVPMSPSEKSDARKRLREMQAAETRRLAREAARNELEAFVYKARSLIDDESFVAASTEVERRILTERTEAANEWLWEEAESAQTKELKLKKADLEKLVKAVTTRVTEAKVRPHVTEAFQVILGASSSFLTVAQENNTLADARGEQAKFTTEELDGLAKLTGAAKDWFEKTSKEQEKKKAHEDPVLRSHELEKRGREIEAEVAKLRKKKAPRPGKKATSTSTTSTASITVTASTSQSPDPDKPLESEGSGHKKDEL